MAVFCDLFGRITSIVHQDLLRGDKDPDGRLEPFHIEASISCLEFHQVQRSQIARRVIQKEIL